MENESIKIDKSAFVEVIKENHLSQKTLSVAAVEAYDAFDNYNFHDPSSGVFTAQILSESPHRPSDRVAALVRRINSKKSNFI
ncbi:hypothetical protein [Bacillus sp. 2205SS5-2]|uniref:hypothetical protein n=1 Tax=Bacillus sp. 2205SS5-2 TaxID=3109031 RepID=UPI003003E37E